MIQQKDNQKLADSLRANMASIVEENLKLTEKIIFSEAAQIVPHIRDAKRIFLVGAGRSGLALHSAAMRLMHLGLAVFMVGGTTTPAIREGDLLLAASGSGKTDSVVKAAEKAVHTGATVVAFSTTPISPLAALATNVVVIPAAQKEDHDATVSEQYAGSLFEQSVLLLTDAIFQTLWNLDQTPAEELWKRHANLE